MYKYYNPNLIRNQRFIKNDQNNHCDFPISVKSFVNNNKILQKYPQQTTMKKAQKQIYNQHQQQKVRDKKGKVNA